MKHTSLFIFLILLFLVILGITNGIADTLHVQKQNGFIGRGEVQAVASGRMTHQKEFLPMTVSGKESVSEEASIHFPVSASPALQYYESEQTWTLQATVVQIKDVSIYGRPGTIAQIVYSMDGFEPRYAWAVIKIDNYYFSDSADLIAIGKEVSLQLSGEYVSSIGVDWDACAPEDEYCRQAGFIEGGFPFSQDYDGLTLCPSNILIRSGGAAKDWINGMLAWRIVDSAR
ncbi:MAG TPA: hypothetical protein VJ987_10065 [Anaerolineales bacterium]|nr:hypothetical protein [Anaerolineales bacterium]